MKVFTEERLKYLIPIALVFLLGAIRFSDSLPVMYADDSVKYSIPLQVIYAKAFHWVLDTPHFSFLAKLLAYFVQVNNSGDISIVIIVQKLAGIFSALFIYLLSHRLSNGNKILSVILALLHGLNPQVLFIEQLIVPESYFFFFGIFATYLLYKVFDEKNERLCYFYSGLFGLSIVLAELSKESGAIWVKSILMVLFLLGILNFKKNKKYIFIFLITIVTVSLVKLPAQIYNYNKHGEFAVQRFDTSSGVLLWTLTEDFLTEGNLPKKHAWLSKLLIQLTNQNRKNFGLPSNSKDERSFFNAISDINSAGRVGSLTHPILRKRLSSKEWGNICKEYWLEISLINPFKTLKRIITYSGRRVVTEPNINLHFYRSSPHPEVELEAIPFTIEPFSLKSKTDPKLFKYKLIEIHDIKASDFEVFHPDHKTSSLKGHFLLMKSRGSDLAYKIPENNVSLWLQAHFKYVPFAYVIIPFFLFCLIQFFLKRLPILLKEGFNLRNLMDLYLLGSVSVYFFLPVLFSSGEPRYRLQFLFYMLLFIASSFRSEEKQG